MRKLFDDMIDKMPVVNWRFLKMLHLLVRHTLRGYKDREALRPNIYYILDIFLRAGFILKEEVIKIQHKMKTTREIWSKASSRDFLLIYHEKLFIFRKPESEDEYKKYKYSSLYWKEKRYCPQPKFNTSRELYLVNLNIDITYYAYLLLIVAKRVSLADFRLLTRDNQS